jgi:hypothetical protein
MSAILTPIQNPDNNFEVSAHHCPNSLIRELKYVFTLDDFTNIIAIPTFHKSLRDLVEMGDEVENEKDELLESVIDYFINCISIFIHHYL